MSAQRRAPFWLRPKWLIGHVIVVAVIIGCASAGMWQLGRHDDRSERNAEIHARAESPTTPVSELVSPDASLDDVGSLQYRSVSATGTFDADGEVFIRPRSLAGAPGWHVVTPLVLDDGRAVLVTRGFAPFGDKELPEVQALAAPPAGPVTVTGLAFPTQERGSIGPTDPAEGTLAEMARVDIARIDRQYGRDLLPVYVQLQTQEPAQEGFPLVLPPPETDDGPHLSYAGQWFLFAVVGLVGWPVLLWRTAKDDDLDRDDPPTGGGGTDGGGGSGGGPAPDRSPAPVGARSG